MDLATSSGLSLKRAAKYLLIAAVFWTVGETAAAGGNTYVEFLWSPTPPDAVARQQTLGFTLAGGQLHQVCVAAPAYEVEGKSLRIEVRDAAGNLTSSREHDDFSGPKRCYAAELDALAEPGNWTFNVYLGEALAASEEIEVARTLGEASFYQPSSMPYVLGRPNYDANIPPDEFVGRLVWIMRVDEGGAVTDVEVEIAEGVGELMKHRAIAAGYMSLFPPDPSRAKEPLEYRRELAFRPD